MRSALEFDANLKLRLRSPFSTKLLLSVATAPGMKATVEKGHDPTARVTFAEHLSRSADAGEGLVEGHAYVATSVRNVLSNPRCFGYVRGTTDAPISVREEDVLHGDRDYHVLAGHRDGTVHLCSWNPTSSLPETWDWAISGVPVCWPGWDSDSLLQRILSESSDGAHIWRIPRGDHPEATDTTRATAREYSNLFLDHLGSDLDTASRSLAEFAANADLQRENRVVHHAIGVDGDGNMIQCVRAGRLEEIGTEMRRLGCEKAIVVDNSGSISVSYRPAQATEWLRLLSLPNHREPGTAYLLIDLGDSRFSISEL